MSGACGDFGTSIIISANLGHKMMRHSLAAIGLFLTMACGAPMETQNISAAVGKQFDVRLSAVATAGYLWEVKDLPAEIHADGVDRAADSKLPGAQVEQVFHFTPSKAGQYTINFVYKRSWETTVEKTQAVQVTVR